MLLCRADKDGYLWRTESGDGALLGPAVAHGDPQPGLQVWLARLTDGRIALVHNPSPTARDPLAVAQRGRDAHLAGAGGAGLLERQRGLVYPRPGAGPSTALAYPTRCRRAGRCTSSTTSAGGTSCTWRSTWPGSEGAAPARRVIQITAPAGETP